jgi:hypothetical protein
MADRRFAIAAAIDLREDFDGKALRALAKRAKDGPQARRLLALAAIYDGATRSEAAKIGGVTLVRAIMRSARAQSRILKTYGPPRLQAV